MMHTSSGTSADRPNRRARNACPKPPLPRKRSTPILQPRFADWSPSAHVGGASLPVRVATHVRCAGGCRRDTVGDARHRRDSQPQSVRDARRAPSASASNLARITCGCTRCSLRSARTHNRCQRSRFPCRPGRQNAPADRRPPHAPPWSCGGDDAGSRILPGGNGPAATRHSCSCRTLAASIE